MALLGRWLREKREAKGLMQKELAVLANVPRSAISEIEGGEIPVTDPRKQAVERLCAALEAEPGEARLLLLLDQIGGVDEDTARFALEYRQFGKRDREILRGVARTLREMGG